MKKFKKILSLACVAATLFSLSVMNAGAYTRRLYGDVNGDGEVTIYDAAMVQKLLEGIIDEFPVGVCFYY